jgi:hypothetical protein
MRASVVFLIAAGVYVAGRWSHNKSAVTIQTVASVIFVLLVISMLDQGKTEEIAKGFAWLFLIVALLSNDSPLGPVLNLIRGSASTGTQLE